MGYGHSLSKIAGAHLSASVQYIVRNKANLIEVDIFLFEDDGITDRTDKCHRYEMGVGWTKDVKTLPVPWNSGGITMVGDPQNVALTLPHL